MCGSSATMSAATSPAMIAQKVHGFGSRLRGGMTAILSERARAERLGSG
jgi:hypothetical protein